MSTKPKAVAPPASGSLALHDIYFILFRHKWVILVTSLLGFIAAGVVYRSRPTTYVSEAKVMLNYIPDSKPVTVDPRDKGIIEVNTSWGAIINTEVTILNSFDLCEMIATNFGPARLMAKIDGSSNVIAAASYIRGNLGIEPQYQSPILKLTFSHPDREIVQPLLRLAIEDYEKKHNEIRTANNATYDTLVLKTESLREELRQIENEKLAAETKDNVVTLEQTRTDLMARKGAASGQIMLANMELIDRQKKLDKLHALLKNSNSTSTNAADTNVVADIPEDKIEDYRRTISLIDSQNRKYLDMLNEYLPSSIPAVAQRQRIRESEKLKKKMEIEEPRLLKMGITAAMADNSAEQKLKEQVVNEEVQIEGLNSKIKFLESQLADANMASSNLEADYATIKELQRKYELTENYYRDYARRLQQARIDLDVGAKNANIQVPEEPIPPTPERSKTPKFMGIAAGIGVGAGLAWAFLMEFIFDRSVKRVKEIEGDLGLRLMISIPEIFKTRKEKKLLRQASKRKLLTNSADPTGAAVVPATNGNGSLAVAPWDPAHALQEHYESLRDRLVTYFEVNNLNHKPKLVAVTGSSHGTGTTSIAAGLAASLSETGDGNVLLVDMNLEHGSAQHFYHGKPNCELDDALTNETRSTAMIQDNFYVVSGQSNDKLAKMLPNRFATLMPKLKASDYDYIIFDMPPIGRTGVAQRLAGFMDLTLMVVEAEKTNKDIVRQAAAVLSESKANFSVILNKTRNYIPERLHQEF